MRLNILTLSICLLSTGDGVFARPTTGALMHRGVNLAASEAAAALQPLDCATPPAGQEEQAGEGEEGAKNEVEIESAFDTAVAVQGGDLKQDLVFTPSTVGKFEYEFQSLAADSVTVTENTSPAAAPAGFEAIEPNSYIVALATSKGAGLTLSKIDYIFDPASAGLAGKDITKAQVGRLCTETNAFVISESLGELEFELEENEVTLNLNKNVTAQGEWGIFLPVAAPAAAAPPAAQEGAGAGAEAGAGAGAEVGAGAGKNEGAGRGRGAAGRNRQDDDDSDDEDDD